MKKEKRKKKKKDTGAVTGEGKYGQEIGYASVIYCPLMETQTWEGVYLQSSNFVFTAFFFGKFSGESPPPTPPTDFRFFAFL